MRNIEIKAATTEIRRFESLLQQHNARFEGVDHQIDIYFKADTGRLKLRQGNIEQSLIWYDRPGHKDLKQSSILLHQIDEEVSTLREMLSRSLGIDVRVEKERKIYFIEPVKFHLDEVQNLGTFVEIEVIDREGQRPIEEMKSICERYIDLFGLKREDFIDQSYSDLIRDLEQQE